jgi:hydrogenase/urease accessory protein HupE
LINVDRNGAITVHVFHDALAFALNDTSARIGDPEMYVLLDGSPQEQEAAFADGRQRFAIGFRLRVDGVDWPYEILQAPDVAGIEQWKREHSGQTLPCKMEFAVKATLPASARAITLQFPEILADTLMIIQQPGVEPLTLPLSAGEISPETAVRVSGATSAAETQSDQAVAGISAWNVAWRFVTLGFTHIIPEGLDHCLFVLGLFLLNPRIRPVLWQISAFTIAHTITLTLTSLHIVGLPASIVEPTIAASIAFIGIENLTTKKVHAWRPAVAFVFGLVHGMGIATAFNEAGFPPGQLVTSLAAFTVGVEAGHVAILLTAFLSLGWFRNRKWYRSRVAIPLSLAIAAIAIWWLVQRVS